MENGHFLNLDEIRTRLIPEEVLQLISYSKSRPHKSGAEIRDACPVHEGNDPNLSISKDGSWFCHSHGCKGGDLISLYQQAKRVVFADAVRTLANHVGVQLEYSRRSEHARANSLEKQEKIENDGVQEAEEEAAALEGSREIASRIWEEASDTGDTSYFEAKGIAPPIGIRYANKYGKQGTPCAVVPMYDVEGRLQSVQFIRKGEKKLFAFGTKAKSTFFPLGWNPGEGYRIVYLCEGIATCMLNIRSIK